MHLSTKPPEIYNFVHTFAKLFMRLTFVIFPIGCHYFSCLTNASPFIFCPYYSTILEIPNKHFDSYQRQSKKNSFSFRNIHIHESKGVDIHYPVHGMIEWENPIPKLKRRPHAKRVLSRFPIRCFVWPTFENPVHSSCKSDLSSDFDFLSPMATYALCKLQYQLWNCLATNIKMCTHLSN